MGRNFLIEIEVPGDGKIITLSADEMNVYIYQKQNGKQERVFEIESKVVATGGKAGDPDVNDMLETTCEYVGGDEMHEPLCIDYQDASLSITSET